MKYLQLILLMTLLGIYGCGSQSPAERAKSLISQGKTSEAADIYREILLKNEDSDDLTQRMKALNAALCLANCLMKLQSYEEAADAMASTIHLAESVNEESPGYTPLVFFADFYRSKAKAHKLAGNMDLARESAEKAIIIYQKVSRQKQAIEDFEEMIRTYPLGQESEGVNQK